MDYLRTGKGRVVVSRCNVRPERAAARVAKRMIASKEPDVESEEEPSFKLSRVFRHVGEGSAMEFFVRYSGYSERSWQPLCDFVSKGEINCVILTYLRKEKLFARAGLDEDLYNDCAVCSCHSCRKVVAYVRLPLDF